MHSFFIAICALFGVEEAPKVASEVIAPLSFEAILASLHRFALAPSSVQVFRELRAHQKSIIGELRERMPDSDVLKVRAFEAAVNFYLDGRTNSYALRHAFIDCRDHGHVDDDLTKLFAIFSLPSP